jgi:hypothetical protein
MPAVSDDTGDRMSLKESCFIADGIKADPSLLDIPLQNIERWTLLGHGNQRTLLIWKLLIERARTSRLGFRVLLFLLRYDSESARNLKGFSPFAGTLSGSEASRFACVSRHC